MPLLRKLHSFLDVLALDISRYKRILCTDVFCTLITRIQSRQTIDLHIQCTWSAQEMNCKQIVSSTTNPKITSSRKIRVNEVMLVLFLSTCITSGAAKKPTHKLESDREGTPLQKNN